MASGQWPATSSVTIPSPLAPSPFPMPEQAVLDILKKVRHIQIVANRTVNDLLAGQYKSVFRGRGMEFDEVREYQPGDDIRTIDWNVTAEPAPLSSSDSAKSAN